jgi:RNA polymerase sigma-70 factor (ECF subfamily)
MYHRKFYERYFGFAMKLAFRYVTDYDRAKEIVHDSFIKIFNNLQYFSNKTESDNFEHALMAWMKRIVVNTGIDCMRRYKSAIVITELTENIWDEHETTVSPDDHLLYKDLLIELSKLPPTYRIVFNMHAIDGYTHKEIGEMLGITTGGTKSIYFKAKSLLQKKVENIMHNKPQYVKP